MLFKKYEILRWCNRPEARRNTRPTCSKARAKLCEECVRYYTSFNQRLTESRWIASVKYSVQEIELCPIINEKRSTNFNGLLISIVSAVTRPRFTIVTLFRKNNAAAIFIKIACNRWHKTSTYTYTAALNTIFLFEFVRDAKQLFYGMAHTHWINLE